VHLSVRYGVTEEKSLVSKPRFEPRPPDILFVSNVNQSIIQLDHDTVLETSKNRRKIT